jgi:hypothetical protein
MKPVGVNRDNGDPPVNKLEPAEGVDHWQLFGKHYSRE